MELAEHRIKRVADEVVDTFVAQIWPAKVRWEEHRKYSLSRMCCSA
jgi:hypothetical protein